MERPHGDYLLLLMAVSITKRSSNWKWTPREMFLLLMTINLVIKNGLLGVPMVAQWKRVWLASMRMQVWSLALLNVLRIRRCRELWCGSQMQLGSGIAVAEASDYSPNWTPSLGTSICCGCGPPPKKEKRIWLQQLRSLQRYGFHPWAGEVG